MGPDVWIRREFAPATSRAGFVPQSRRRLVRRRRAGERPAGLGLGLGAAVLVRAIWPDSAYVWFFGVALFGALFVWLMIFVTHIAFCHARSSASGHATSIDLQDIPRFGRLGVSRPCSAATCR